MDLCNWSYCDRCRIYRKDLLVDAAIVAVVLGAVALIVRSFPETFTKLLPFLK
tara:strand:- start:255 stop:413 length:159 start_codon:yes stop_codon:yes gene_type:complete